MADTEFQTYRPFGLFEAQNVPITIAEGDPRTLIGSVNESGLPNGVYELKFGVSWDQPIDRYMVFSATVQGVELNPVAKAHSTPAGNIDEAFTFGFAVVTDGTLEVSAYAEFPTQTGSANGTVEAGRITWERKLDTPPPA